MHLKVSVDILPSPSRFSWGWLMRAWNSLSVMYLWSELRGLLVKKWQLQSSNVLSNIGCHAQPSNITTSTTLHLGEIVASKWNCSRKKEQKVKTPEPDCWQAAVNTTRSFFHISTWGFVKLYASGSVSTMLWWFWWNSWVHYICLHMANFGPQFTWNYRLLLNVGVQRPYTISLCAWESKHQRDRDKAASWQ